jgi:hypothetical protein
MTTFGTLTEKGLINVREIKQSDLQRCAFTILVADHYRADGSCKCNDKAERKKMIKDWGYTRADFKDIPLKS